MEHPWIVPAHKRNSILTKGEHGHHDHSQNTLCKEKLY